MRPIDRGSSPRSVDFDEYRDAFPELLSRLGPYCSYCERRVPAPLAVEHIQPKGLPQYVGLTGRWDNFLLACVNCNSTKRDKDVQLDRVFLPDRDNTFTAFEYTSDGKVEPSASLSVSAQQIASDTLALLGLDKARSKVTDENGELVAIDRVAQRMEALETATTSLEDLRTCPTDEMRRAIARLANATGFFSIWMKVFKGDPVLLGMLIDAFPGTAVDCFDAQTKQSVSPRPSNGLSHCGKL